MAYAVNASSVQVTTVGSSAGQINDAEDIELVNQWMKPVEREEHLILDWLPNLRAKVNQQTHYVGQSYNPPVQAVLDGATSAGSATIDLTGNPTDLGFKPGDYLFIREYYPGQTTYFDPTKTTKHLITTVGSADVTASANIGVIHPATVSVATVVSKATPMATQFGTEPVFRGDRIAQTVQRLQSGMIKVDERMRHTPTHASKDQFVDDMANLRETMNDKLEGAYINSVYQAESGATPGLMRGMIDWADEISANVIPMANKQITVHHFASAVMAKRKTRRGGAGKTIILDLDSMAAIDLALEPYKLYNEKSDTISIQVNKLNFRWGDLTFMPVPFPWPDGTILVTDKEDWGAGNYDGMPWKPVKRTEEHTNAPTEEFGIYGDFTLDCYDVYRQILFTNVNTFVDRYAGRRTYGQAG